MIKVFLRKKKLLHGKLGLYLDFYPPIEHPETKQPTRREHLKLYVHEKPKSQVERDHNKATLLLGENVRAQRQLDLQAGAYGFAAVRSREKNFLEHLTQVCEQKKNKNRSTRDRWIGIALHFERFAGPTVRFREVDKKLCTGFRDYLEFDSGLAATTAESYFNGFRSVVKSAVEARVINMNPLAEVKGIRAKRPQRNYLTLEELKRLAGADCGEIAVKRAGIFSTFTGLRYSDIKKLKWSEIQFSHELGHHIRFTQQKTGDSETLPISAEAVEILGERGDQNERVFRKLEKWQLSYYLPRWLLAADISKKFSFHCFRHTYATLQLTFGTDLYTVSKLLGHTNIRTTEIYAKIVDQKKREAAERITLK